MQTIDISPTSIKKNAECCNSKKEKQTQVDNVLNEKNETSNWRENLLYTTHPRGSLINIFLGHSKVLRGWSRRRVYIYIYVYTAARNWFPS